MSKKQILNAEAGDDLANAREHPLSFILDSKGIFILGCFGGMAPSIIDIAKRCLGALDAPDFKPFGWTSIAIYISGALILGLVGGVVVCAMREREYGKAIFLGVSAPALILTALHSPTTEKSKYPSNIKIQEESQADKGSKGANVWNINPFVSTAYAQIPTSKMPSSGTPTQNDVALSGVRSVEVFSRNLDRTFYLIFYSKQNDELATQQIKAAVKTQIYAPAGASYLCFAAEDSISQKFKLPKDPATVLDFQVKVTFQEKFSISSFFTQSPKIVAEFEITSEERKKIEPGREGWMYLGMYLVDEWLPNKRHTDLAAAPEKAQGQRVSTAYENTFFRKNPVRPEGVGQDKDPIMSLGQRVQILEVKQSDNRAGAWWARIKVLE